MNAEWNEAQRGAFTPSAYNPPESLYRPVLRREDIRLVLKPVMVPDESVYDDTAWLEADGFDSIEVPFALLWAEDPIEECIKLGYFYAPCDELIYTISI